MVIKSIISASLVFFVSATRLMAAADIPIVNNTRVAIELWSEKEGDPQWTDSPRVIKPRQTLLAHFTGARYYLFVRLQSDATASYVIGWIDPDKLRRRSPTATIVLNGRAVTKTREVRYAVVTHLVQEQRTHDVPYIVYVPKGGRWVQETRVKAESYSVCVPVVENKIRTETYETVALAAESTNRDGTLIMSEVTFSTEKPGAVIRYQIVGGGEVRTSKKPTNSTESIGVGRYYVWTERNGVPSSPQNRDYDICEQRVEISISELSAKP